MQFHDVWCNAIRALYYVPQIHCKDVVLDDHDVAKSIVEFAAHAAIEKLVVGATARSGFVR